MLVVKHEQNYVLKIFHKSQQCENFSRKSRTKLFINIIFINRKQYFKEINNIDNSYFNFKFQTTNKMLTI